PVPHRLRATRPARVRRRLATIAALIGAAAAVAALSATPTLANPIQIVFSTANEDNWPGNIQVAYQAPGSSAPSVIPWGLTGSTPPPALSATFGGMWSQSIGSICGQLKSQIAKALTGQGYGLANWDSCHLPVAGDLQAQTWSNGALELRWVVRGNAIQFDVDA